MPIRGVDYCLNEWGDPDAEAIFYLHGWADMGSTFQFVVDALPTGRRVVAPDWRGFGRTTNRSTAYWFPDYLADLDAILHHYSPDRPVSLVGHSMGGNIAALYSGIMPQRVAALVNVEGFGLKDSDPNDAPARYRRWLEAASEHPEFTSYADFESLAARLRKRSPRLTESQANFVAREWAVDVDGEVRLRADPNHKLPNAVLYRRAEAAACWRNIEAPTLLVSGCDSRFSSTPEAAQAFSVMAGAECRVGGVGHMIHFEAAGRLAEEIEQFLKKTL